MNIHFRCGSLIRIAVLGFSLLFLGAGAATADNAVEKIPVQHNGQIKSFESFSRHSLEVIAQKTRLDGRSASQVMMDKLSNPSELSTAQWIRVRYQPLLETLGLPKERTWFSFDEINGSVEKIRGLVISAKDKRDKDLRPSELEQKAEGLFSQWIEVKTLQTGELLKVIPPAMGDEWLSPVLVQGSRSDEFKKILELWKTDAPAAQIKAAEWNQKIYSDPKNKFKNKIDLEIFYYKLNPFRSSWIIYLLAFIALWVGSKKGLVKKSGIILCVAAIAFHTLGLALRVIILGRPPVSNMYESMVYMNWIVIVAAIIFSAIKKNTSVLGVGSLLSGIVMIYAELLPMDASLDVLVPVLRSNYWLTIHVLTIVSSYGVLGLAMGLGHRHLWLSLTKKNWPKKEEEQSATIINRVIQVGTLLLGIGTVLGGVWANESWGRFWGWDPKETWALITFLGYLIVIHLKYSKSLSSFGLAVSSVLGFQLVLMTWYGVNFVLGRGLHSYGQGSGGAIWIIYYLVAETLFLGWVFWKRFKR